MKMVLEAYDNACIIMKMALEAMIMHA